TVPPYTVRWHERMTMAEHGPQRRPPRAAGRTRRGRRRPGQAGTVGGDALLDGFGQGLPTTRRHDKTPRRGGLAGCGVGLSACAGSEAGRDRVAVLGDPVVVWPVIRFRLVQERRRLSGRKQYPARASARAR